MSAESGNRGNVAKRFAACQDGAFLLDKDVLRKILLNPELGNIKVYVISVVGPLRSGKSFLMSLFVRYLRRRATGQNEIEDRTEALSGFEWKAGSVGVTKGMWMWPEVFLLDTGSGEKVGVVLVDTQGVFDEKSAKTEDALLFSVTALTSSVLIYNVQNGIDQKALEQFVEFLISMCNEFMPSDKTTLEKCLFLVRDWQFVDEYHSGIDGGKEFLEAKFNIFNESNDNTSYVRKCIKDMFKDVACFLMSHPGKMASRNQFDGKLADLEEDFVGDIQSLATYLFGLEDTNSAKLTCQKLFQLYTSFSGRKIANFKDFITFNLECKLEDISTKVKKSYESGFTSSVAMSTIVKEHKDNREKALLDFDEQVVDLNAEQMENTELFRNNLCKELDDLFFKKLLNLAEMEYKKMFDEEECDLEVLVENHMKAIEDIYSSMKMASAVGEPEQYKKARSDLDKNLKLILGEKLKHAIVAEYDTQLDMLVTEFGPSLSLTIQKLSDVHGCILQENQENLRKLTPTWIDDKMSSTWTKKINTSYCKRAQYASIIEYESIMMESANMENFCLCHYNTQEEIKRKFREEVSSKSEDATDDYCKELKEKIKDKQKEVALEIITAHHKKMLRAKISSIRLAFGGKEKEKFDEVKGLISKDLERMLHDIPQSELEITSDKAIKDVQETYDTLLQFGDEIYNGALLVGTWVTGITGAAGAAGAAAGAAAAAAARTGAAAAAAAARTGASAAAGAAAAAARTGAAAAGAAAAGAAAAAAGTAGKVVKAAPVAELAKDALSFVLTKK